MRGSCGNSQRTLRGKSPSPAALRASTSPRKRGEVATAANPRHMSRAQQICGNGNGNVLGSVSNVR